MKNKIGLLIAGMVPMHLGHEKIINIMLENHKTNVLIFGGPKTLSGRYFMNRTEREQQVYNVFKNKLNIIQIYDLSENPNNENSFKTNLDRWWNYVKLNLSQNNFIGDYQLYSGSTEDAKWYSKSIIGENGLSNENITIIDRNILNISATKVRKSLENNILNDKTDQCWKQNISEINHELVYNAMKRYLKKD